MSAFTTFFDSGVNTDGIWNFNVSYMSDSLVIEGENSETVTYAISNILKVALDSLERKEKYLHFPKVHRNDVQGPLKKVLEALRVSSPQNQDYGSYAKKIIEGALEDSESKPDEWINSLSMMSIESDGSIHFGNTSKTKISNLQLFKVEKYEHGKGFGDLKVKADFIFDEKWFSLVIAGFCLTYSAFTQGEIILSIVPEEVLIRSLRDREYKRAVKELTGSNNLLVSFFGERGIFRLPEKINLPPNPIDAYSILLGIALKNEGFVIEGFPYVLARLRFTGQTFTLLEKSDIRIEPFLDFAKKLSKKTLEVLREFLVGTIMLSYYRNDYYASKYGDYSVCYRLVQSLYQTILGSRKPEETVYIMARSLPENSPLRDEWILRDIYEVFFPTIRETC